MAITPLMLEMIMKLGPGKGRVVSAGYPDMLITEEDLKEMLGEKYSQVTHRDDSEAIKNQHPDVKGDHRFAESGSVFKALGYDLRVVDVYAWRGGEEILDLNVPMEPRQYAGMFGAYEIVIDPGTSEHCFHIGQAAINLASCVAEGGLIIQLLPLQAYNHGFYNVNPTWFHSFYPQNGFEILWLHAVQRVKVGEKPSVYQIPAHKRFLQAPFESYMACVAKRVEMRPVGPVVQHKYARKMAL